VEGTLQISSEQTRPPQLADNQPADIYFDICTDPSSLEVARTIKAMKSSKAPGADEITAERCWRQM
jgi:hypothetical protein